MGAIEGIGYYFAQLISGAKLKAVLASLVVMFEFAVGGVDAGTQSLLILMGADLAFGFADAWRKKEISFKKLRQGVWKGLLYTGALSLGHHVDVIVLHTTAEFGFKNAFVVYLGVNEALSIIRHMDKLGLPVPKKVTEKLEGIRNSLD